MGQTIILSLDFTRIRKNVDQIRGRTLKVIKYQVRRTLVLWVCVCLWCKVKVLDIFLISYLSHWNSNGICHCVFTHSPPTLSLHIHAFRGITNGNVCICARDWLMIARYIWNLLLLRHLPFYGIYAICDMQTLFGSCSSGLTWFESLSLSLSRFNCIRSSALISLFIVCEALDECTPWFIYVVKA